MHRSKRIILRDLSVFLLKLSLDGLKDIVLWPLAVTAAAIDLLLPGPRTGHLFYRVMRMGEGFDRWLCLFGAADRANVDQDGLFGASRAGSDSLLGRLEAIVLGHDEAESTGSPARAA